MMRTTTNTIVSTLLVLIVIVFTGGGDVSAQDNNSNNNDSSSGDTTLRTISTFRLDLTMETRNTASSGNSTEEGGGSTLPTTTTDNTMDLTIQSIAEEHLHKIYEMQYKVVSPTRVLLTVVSDDNNFNNNNNNNDKSDNAIANTTGGGIVVKAAYLGGVVGFPTNPTPTPNKEELDGNNDEQDYYFVYPTRSELDAMTLTAFEIPGYGEYFLRELQRSNDVGLDGLILIEAVSVDAMESYTNTGSGGRGDNDAAAIEEAEFEGGGGDPSSSSSNQQQQSGMVMIAGHSMNIWAIAAVAALGAMFLVIVLCTSILYCDWRSRKVRREERKRDRILMQSSAAAEAHRVLHGGDGKEGGGYGDLEMGNKKKTKKRISSSGAGGAGAGAGGSRANSRRSNSSNNNNDRSLALQVVIPSASGETEDLDSPESYTSSKQIGSSSRYPSSGSTHRGSGNNLISPNKMVVVTKKYRRSSGGGGSSSTAGAGTNNKEQQQQQQAIVQQVQDPSQAPPEEDVNNDNKWSDDNYNKSNIVTTTGDGGTLLLSQDALSFPTNNGSNSDNTTINNNRRDDYSVGEDTAMMLYPVYNRGRLASKDYEGYVSDDFDGYSIDGMSAIGDGGVSQFGGSGGAGSSSRGGRSGMKKTTTTTGGGSGGMGGSNADIYYAGNVPRDFDSVWGDDTDDEDLSSRISRERSSKMITTSAYADLNQSLNQLVEQEMIYEGTEEGSHSGMTSLDNVSVTSGASGKHDDQAGAFTMELLGGNGGGDDDDSILGGMNDDLSTIAGPADDNTAKYLPTAADDDDSVNSTPSWAAPIQLAMQKSVKNLFRRTNATSPLESGIQDSDLILPQESNDTGTTATTTPAANNSYISDIGNNGQSSARSPNKVKSIFLDKEKEKEQRTKEKFVTSLMMNSDDNSSVGSNRSSRSNCSNRSTLSIGSSSSRESKKSHVSVRDATTALASNERVLGTSTSYDEKDEDPAAMIDNINSMLSECREMLDTESGSSGGISGRSTPAASFK